ncbi:hypothetical protein [Chamaesiphon sp. VAR_48_metabat_403]|uniref:hypothetical protein n=1 Tax=Chamaesiphon sp. VAR_48_metabat_403 TaxID=2964700 RepID=UPI00286E7317|nr:hypothetical protein [Chamaesiphon sp. VAR_48_metabat_403]
MLLATTHPHDPIAVISSPDRTMTSLISTIESVEHESRLKLVSTNLQPILSLATSF